jgi:hypothetical protein
MRIRTPASSSVCEAVFRDAGCGYDVIPTRQELAMLWTILVILAIVALAIFIFSRVRGGGRGI